MQRLLRLQVELLARFGGAEGWVRHQLTALRVLSDQNIADCEYYQGYV